MQDIKLTSNRENPIEPIKGLPKLVNHITKLIYTTKGSDPEHPDKGCYIKRMVGKNYSLREAADKLMREIERVESQVINTQAEMDLPEEEALKEIRLERVYNIKNSKYWNLRAEYVVINEAGESYEGVLFEE